jgi:hypothetical protein
LWFEPWGGVIGRVKGRSGFASSLVKAVKLFDSVVSLCCCVVLVVVVVVVDGAREGVEGDCA